jgi:hypothetical protein
MAHYLAIGRCIFAEYPTPTRYYGTLKHSETGEVVVCTLPTNRPGEALTAAHTLRNAL